MLKNEAKQLVKANFIDLAIITIIPNLLASAPYGYFYLNSLSSIKYMINSNETVGFTGTLGIPQTILSILLVSYVSTATSINLLDWYRTRNKKHLELTYFVKRYVFDYKKIISAVSADLWGALFVLLWSLIPFVGWIMSMVKAYSYNFANLLAYDDTSLAFDTAVKKSIDVMDGQKYNLFVLHLSMIGWIILTVITFGLAAVFTVPYMTLCDIIFYERLNK